MTVDGAFFCDSYDFKKIVFDESLTQKPDNLLRIVYVEPCKPAYEAEIIDSLHGLQKAVGNGLIEHILMENNCYGRDGKLRWRVVVAGHSYGGAVAVICGVYLRRMLGIRPDLVTFGAPKTLVLLASKTLARGCFRRVFQYAHRSDLVPRMPPLPGFWHVKRVPLGTFGLKGLFRLQEYHYESYFRQETFAGHEEDDV